MLREFKEGESEELKLPIINNMGSGYPENKMEKEKRVFIEKLKQSNWDEWRKKKDSQKLTFWEIGLLGGFDRIFDECIEAAKIVYEGDEENIYWEEYYETDYYLNCFGRPKLVGFAKINKEKYEKQMEIKRKTPITYSGRLPAKYTLYKKEKVKNGWKEELIKKIEGYKD